MVNVYTNDIPQDCRIIQEKLRQMASQRGVEQICSPVLDRIDFYFWSGSSKPEQHHYGTGGLARHTYEVVRLCSDVNNLLACTNKSCDSGELFTAAVWHDFGKLRDYDMIDGVWQGTDHRTNIHHLPESAILFDRAAQSCHWLNDKRDRVLHAILAHHGQREWGSPIRPNSIMAWILHLCDSISARTEECYNRDSKL